MTEQLRRVQGKWRTLGVQINRPWSEDALLSRAKSYLLSIFIKGSALKTSFYLENRSTFNYQYTKLSGLLSKHNLFFYSYMHLKLFNAFFILYTFPHFSLIHIIWFQFHEFKVKTLGCWPTELKLAFGRVRKKWLFEIKFCFCEVSKNLKPLVLQIIKELEHSCRSDRIVQWMT